MNEQSPRKGAIIKLLGVVLVFLGVMDSMLAWRGGFAASDFYAVLITAGLAMYAVGAVLDRRGA